MKTQLIAAAAAVLLAGVSAPAFAQSPSDPTMATQTAPVVEDDEGFDLGWLGLLGLAGLLGLRRKANADLGVHSTATRPL